MTQYMIREAGLCLFVRAGGGSCGLSLGCFLLKSGVYRSVMCINTDGSKELMDGRSHSRTIEVDSMWFFLY